MLWKATEDAGSVPVTRELRPGLGQPGWGEGGRRGRAAGAGGRQAREGGPFLHLWLLHVDAAETSAIL